MVRIALLVLLASIKWTARLAAQSPPAPEYLYLWTASEDSTQPDFLAVLDVTEDSTRYGRLAATTYGIDTSEARGLLFRGAVSGTVLRRPSGECRNGRFPRGVPFSGFGAS